jgi:hypothetical protein
MIIIRRRRAVFSLKYPLVYPQPSNGNSTQQHRHQPTRISTPLTPIRVQSPPPSSRPQQPKPLLCTQRHSTLQPRPSPRSILITSARLPLRHIHPFPSPQRRRAAWRSHALRRYRCWTSWDRRRCCCGRDAASPDPASREAAGHNLRDADGEREPAEERGALRVSRPWMREHLYSTVQSARCVSCSPFFPFFGVPV